MTSFIQNILWNSVSGFVEAGTRTAGQYAGDALIKAGDMVENSGRSVGGNIERRASQYGSAISGQSYQPSAKALPSTARRPVAKRSNSLPASTKPAGPISRTPIGANKYPGGNQVNGTTGTAKKQITSGASGAKTASKNLPKAFPNNVPYGTTVTPQKSKQASSLTSAKGSTVNKANNLPKPYPSGANGNPYPTEKKSAVKPGLPKPFTPPTEPKTDENDKRKDKKKNKKRGAYPGTNTLPGQGSKVPVTQQVYKPMDRLAAPAERGKAQHIAGF